MADPDDMTDAEFEALVAETERLYRDDPAFPAYVIRAWGGGGRPLGLVAFRLIRREGKGGNSGRP